MDVGSGGNREIDGATTWPPASSFHGGGQTPPLPRNLSGDGKRLKRSLDDAEPLGSQSALVILDGDKDTKVQLGQRGHTDGRLDRSRCLPADKHRSIQQSTHALGERVLK